jgi:ABC-type phosphate transport system permease subunit
MWRHGLRAWPSIVIVLPVWLVAFIGHGVLGVASGWLVLSAMLLPLAVVLINRPRALIPPALRTQPSLLSELRGRLTRSALGESDDPHD